MDRIFDSAQGDRVAMASNNPYYPARTLTDAMDYAIRRAKKTGHRQYLKRSRSHARWWLCLVQDEKNVVDSKGLNS